MPAPDLIRAHQLAQINNGALAAALVMELFTEFQRGALTRDELVTALVGADMLTHNAAVDLARRFVADLRDAQGVDGELIDATFNLGGSFGRAVGTLSDLDQARTKIPVERDYDAEFWRIVQGLAVRADRAAKMAGRETVMASAEASGRRWRRVSDGNPCAFCAMLVARGDAYTSEKAALHVVGRGTGVKPRGTRGLGEKFHNNCGCTVVEVVGTWTPTAEEQRYIDLYNACAGGDASEVTARMRAEGHGIINDAHVPKTQTGGSGGGDKPPKRGAAVGSFDDKERRIADYLEAQGHKVVPNAQHNLGGRVADSLVDGLRAEFKTLEVAEPTSATIRNAVTESKRRGGQAPFLIFDARGTSLTQEEARLGIRRALGLGTLVSKVRVIGDTYDIEEERSG